MKVQKVARNQCIKYKGLVNNRKDTGTLEADGPHTTLKGQAPRHVQEGLNKGEQTRTWETEWMLSQHPETIEAKSMLVNSGCKAYASEQATRSLAQVFDMTSEVLKCLQKDTLVDTTNAIDHRETNIPVSISNMTNNTIRNWQANDQRMKCSCSQRSQC